MAASYSWPTAGGFPQVPQRDYQESIGLNILRTPVDSGPAKMRRRSLRPDTLSVRYILTTAQVSTLKTFVFDTIRGTARFYYPHPRTGATVEARIIPQQDGQFFLSSYLAPGYYNVTLQLELMP